MQPRPELLSAEAPEDEHRRWLLVRREMGVADRDEGRDVEAVAAAGAYGILVGEVAGALQGWRLVLGGGAMEVCSPRVRAQT